MNIGIIGAGNIGKALATKLVRLGHAVRIANSRGPDTLGEVAEETGARAVTVHEAVRGVDLVVVTIPQKAVPALPAGLFRDVPKETIVVDTGNYYPSIRDGAIAEIEAGTTESGWVARLLGRPVLKAFNNIMTHSLAEGGLPRGAKDRIALPVAGDDPSAKATLIALLDALGFDGVDAGALDESWRQQPGTPAYCTDLDADRVRRALATADRAKAALRRESSLAMLGALPPGSGPDVVVAEARKIFEAPR